MKMTVVFKLLIGIAVHLATGAMVNIALRKPASMSSSMSGYRASTAVDGNTDAEGYDPDQIINTNTGQAFAWWKVDLQREVQDATVRIYFRTDYKQRRNGVKLYTSTSPFPNSAATSQGQLCHNVTGDPSGSDIPDVYNVTCPGRWRYLLLYTDTDNDGNGPILDFGEVEVWACDYGSYGPGCSLVCSERKCVEPSTECNYVTGQCRHGCKLCFKGIHCVDECESGTYGNCSLSCTDRNCLNRSADCNHKTGQCEGGCQPGYHGIDCRKACDVGINYGVSCTKSCTDRHCNQPSSECDTRTGECIDGCQVGWTGVDCTSQCPADTFGSNCTSCSTRHCQGESDCPADGTCSQGCQDGWIGNTCLQECSPGMYGPGCSMACGKCSSDEVCHHVTGNCPSGCKAGWRTEKCTVVCSEATYGSDCTEKCGKCDSVCDSVDGSCPAGCLDGYNGTKCDLALQADASVKEPVYFGVVSLAGAVVGTFTAVVLLAVGVHLCLIRQGRIKWIKTSEDKKHVQQSRDFTQMSSISPRPAETSEFAQSSNQVYNNDYAVLDAGTKTDNKDYDVIKPHYYQNV